MSFRKRHPVLATLTLAVLDGTCFSAAHVLAVHATRPADTTYAAHAVAGLPALAAALCVWYVVAFRQRLFLTRRGELLVPQLFTTTRVLFTWLILTVFLTAMMAPQRVDRPALLIFTATSIVLVLMGRAILRLSVWDLRRRGYNVHRLLIVGANHCTEHLVTTIRANEQFGWRIDGFLDDEPAAHQNLERQGIPYLGKTDELDRLLVQRVIDGVYVNLSLRTSYNTVQKIVSACEGVGVPVRMVAELFPLRIGWTDVRRMSGVPVVSLVSRPSTHLRSASRRLTEWLIASALLALLSPVFIIIAATVRITSGSPVFVKQLRAGATRHPFEMLAFRTAKVDRRGRIAGFTRVGSFLRRYGLDELPQLINIWRGEMALIGARTLQPANCHPCAGCPHCLSDLEPGLASLWKPGGENAAARPGAENAAARPGGETQPAPAVEASQYEQAGEATDQPDEIEAVMTDTGYEGRE